jgi:hypothetical protein
MEPIDFTHTFREQVNENLNIRFLSDGTTPIIDGQMYPSMDFFGPFAVIDDIRDSVFEQLREEFSSD